MVSQFSGIEIFLKRILVYLVFLAMVHKHVKYICT